MGLGIAIVGSGPAAFYTAAALLKAVPDCTIDIVERLPTPFGLIRYGVAPDHEHTKNVMKAYGRTALSPPVRFFGNVEVGRDVSLTELRELYDAVVLAVGAARDRALGVPGEDKKGVVGSASFVGWYNGHPDFADLAPDLSIKSVVIVGQGNVAIDIARVLVKTPEEMARFDLCDHAAAAIHASPIEDVYMVGRRGPVEAKFTNVELREMGYLENARPVVDAAQLPASVEGEMNDRDRRMKEKNLATLREFAEAAPDPAKQKRVHILFNAAPVEILGGERVEAVRFERTKVEEGRAVGTGEFFDIPCGLVVAAIGYRSDAVAEAPFDERQGIVKNVEGRVAPGLYAVGWIKRGPTGVIGTNKVDGEACAEQIAADLKEGTKPGRAAFEALLKKRKVNAIGFEDWQAIERAEIAAARPGAPRRKFARIADMLAVLEEARAEAS
ncbi:MAG: FAD-dependent oxidoreductase [Alphaproteobacteria bacterium]